ncbi:MAG: hypothetical protein RSF40_01915 [Oscillospiraceae bacterium]
MEAFFGILGILGVLIFIVWSLVCLIAKKPTRTPLIGFFVSVLLFIISVIMPSPTDKATSAEESTSKVTNSPTVSYSITTTTTTPITQKATVTTTKPQPLILSSGNYVAGVDFPAGTYNIIAVKGDGVVSSSNYMDDGILAAMGVSADDFYQNEYKNIAFPNKTTLKIDGLTIKLERVK